MCLQLFAWLEPDSFTRWYCYLFAGTGISSDTAFPRFDDKYPKTSQFNSLASGESLFHRLEKGLHRLFGFHFRYACFVSDSIDNIQLDHG